MILNAGFKKLRKKERKKGRKEGRKGKDQTQLYGSAVLLDIYLRIVKICANKNLHKMFTATT